MGAVKSCQGKDGREGVDPEGEGWDGSGDNSRRKKNKKCLGNSSTSIRDSNREERSSCQSSCHRGSCRSRSPKRKNGPASADPTNVSPLGAETKGSTSSALRSRNVLMSVGDMTDSSKEILPRLPSVKEYDQQETRHNNTSASLSKTNESIRTQPNPVTLKQKNTPATAAAETDSGTTCTDSASPSSRGIEIKTQQRPKNIFTDPMNWIDTDAVFAWTITVVNALTKEKEELSVYNNDTVASVREAFAMSTGCSSEIRLYHLHGMTCHELDEGWQLKYCIRNRSSIIAYPGDLNALLEGSDLWGAIPLKAGLKGNISANPIKT